MKRLAFFVICTASVVAPSCVVFARTLQRDSCPVTAPNGTVAGLSERHEGSYGNALLSVGPFEFWPNGTIVLSALRGLE
jgi:hypothetical protein